MSIEAAPMPDDAIGKSQASPAHPNRYRAVHTANFPSLFHRLGVH